MSNQISIRVGGMDSFNILLATKPIGVSISHPLAEKRGKTGMAFDDAESILQCLVDLAMGVEVSLLSNWLFSITHKPDGKKTTINGRQIPSDQAELYALIKEILEQQHQSEANKKDGINNP
jgi:hypothetical protein